MNTEAALGINICFAITIVEDTFALKYTGSVLIAIFGQKEEAGVKYGTKLVDFLSLSLGKYD